MTAIVLNTERILTGPMVTPIPRRRPQVLARQTVTLDRLSGGRFILGAGSGGDHPTEYAKLGEPSDAKVRAARLDEGSRGADRPVVRPDGQPQRRALPRHRHHIPANAAAVASHPDLDRRAVALSQAGRARARWDGYVPIKADEGPTTPDDVAEMAKALDWPIVPVSPAVFNGAQDPQPFFDAGATWCLDGPDYMAGFDIDEVRGWIADGPRR